MKKNAIILMCITLIAKFSGFARDVVLATTYGTSAISDSYIIAITIPSVFFSLVGTGILTSYIPLYNRLKKEKSSNIARLFTNNVVNIVTLSTFLILIIVFFNTNLIVKIFASGFSGKTFDLTVRFTRITIISIVFTGGIYVFQGYLQSNDNFFVPAFTSIPSNLMMILSIYLSKIFSEILLPVGNLMVFFIQFLILSLYAIKKKYRHTLSIKIDDNFKNFILLASPVVVSVSVNQINLLVDRTIASMIVVGGISALNYSNRLITFIHSIFVLAILTVSYPLMAKVVIQNDIIKFKRILTEITITLCILLFPITTGALILSKPIVILLFGRGAFGTNAVELTSSTLFYYSLGLVAIGLREVLSRAFYSMHDTKTPVINAIFGMILNVILNILLSRFMGISGLALATSISAVFTAFLMFAALRKKIGSFGINRIFITSIKLLFSTIIMAGVVKVCFSNLTLVYSQNLSLLISIAVGVIVYFLVAIFVRIKEVNEIGRSLLQKIRI